MMKKEKYIKPTYQIISLSATEVHSACWATYEQTLQMSPFLEVGSGEIVFTNSACAEKGIQLEPCFSVPFAAGILFNS